MSDVFKPAGQNTTTTSLFKLTQSLWKTNHGQKSLSYVEPSIWNKLPDFLKTTENVTMYTNTELELSRTFSTKKFTIFHIFFENLSNFIWYFFSNLLDKFVKLVW